MLGGIAAWLHAGGGLVDVAGVPSRQLHTWVISPPLWGQIKWCPQGKLQGFELSPPYKNQNV